MEQVENNGVKIGPVRYTTVSRIRTWIYRMFMITRVRPDTGYGSQMYGNKKQDRYPAKYPVGSL